jgi:hypothetical protein
MAFEEEDTCISSAILTWRGLTPDSESNEQSTLSSLPPLSRTVISTVRVFITAVPIIKLFAWGEGDSGGHVLRETTSRCLCGLAPDY